MNLTKTNEDKMSRLSKRMNGNKAIAIKVALNRLNSAYQSDSGVMTLLVENLSKKLSWNDIDRLSVIIIARREEK